MYMFQKVKIDPLGNKVKSDHLKNKTIYWVSAIQMFYKWVK